MKQSIFTLLTVVTFLWPQVASAEDLAYRIAVEQSSVEFSFKSTLHPVKGVVKDFDGAMLINEDGEFVIRNAKINFIVSSMDTQESKRDENMLKMFQVDNYPEIFFEMNSQKFSIGQNDAILKGNLMIKTINQPVEIATHLERVDGGYLLSGETQLSLKAFKLRPPAVAVLIRVFDSVKIKFKVLLKKEG